MNWNWNNCKLKIFNRNFSQIFYPCHLLDLDHFVIDFGFKIDNSFDPGVCIEMVCCKALKMFFSGNRLVESFKYLVKSLIVTLVLLIFEYVVIFWNLYTINDFRQLDKIRRRFWKFCWSFVNYKSWFVPVSEIILAHKKEQVQLKWKNWFDVKTVANLTCLVRFSKILRDFELILLVR